MLHVLYLIFNEGYTTSSGDEITRTDLTHEAIRLTRELHRLRPDDAEVKGLLALMLLTEARRPARIDPAGRLVDLADQDRRLWNRLAHRRGRPFGDRGAPTGASGRRTSSRPPSPRSTTRPSGPEDTDWPQILLLYQLLDRLAPNPMATLNRPLALAMVEGPEAGLRLLATLDDDKRVASHHRLFAMRGHLLEMAGDRAGAGEAFEMAARRCTSLPERTYLQERAGLLGR